MISLITISCIAAAFAPVVSKRLQSDTIRAGSTGKLESNCSEKFGEDCKFCGDKCCYICDSNSTCETDEFKNTCKCACVKCNATKADGGYGEGCVECNSSGCTKCQDGNNGYYLKEDKTCAKCTQAGKTFSDGKVCVASCEASVSTGYTCRNGKKYYCKDLYNTMCASCDATKCLSCDWYNGYDSVTGNCFSCSLYFSSCGRCTKTICNNCTDSRAVMKMDDPKHNCVSCASLITGCSSCSGTAASPTCTGCQVGYYLQNGKCNECSGVANCTSCQSDAQKCLACAAGYYPVGSTCRACTAVNCVECNENGKCALCKQGYHLDEAGICVSDNNSFHCSDSNFMQIQLGAKKLCITKRNMGDSPALTIPSTVAVVNVNTYCYAEQGQKCCWKGQTAGTCSTGKNGDYSGCERTVCSQNAAKEICDRFEYAGLKWRLLNVTERDQLAYTAVKYTMNLGNDGLQLCATNVNKPGIEQCDYSHKCYGVWTGPGQNRCAVHQIAVEGGNGLCMENNLYGTHSNVWAQGVRCVAEIQD